MSATLHNEPHKLARLAWAVNVAAREGEVNPIRLDPGDVAAAEAAGLDVREGRDGWGWVDNCAPHVAELARIIAEANRSTCALRYDREVPPLPADLGYITPAAANVADELSVAWTVLDRYRVNIHDHARGGRMALAVIAALQDALAWRALYCDEPDVFDED